MPRRRVGRVGKVVTSVSIVLALMVYVSSGVANAQAPAGAPPGAPPAAEPAPMAPPPAEIAPPPAYAPVSPGIALSPPIPPPTTTPAIPALPPLKIVGPNATIRFGIFLQPQFESLGSVAVDGYANNLYLRRARFLAGGTLYDRIEWFLETDSPNLFKGATAVPAMGQALKTTSTMIVQDLFGTYKALGNDMLKIDAGYTLPAGSHNSMQSAFTLFGWDYFAYTFQNSNAFGAVTPPVGRDLGVQARGLVADGHVEYRVGIWQGQRNAATATEQSARNFFRTAARVQIPTSSIPRRATSTAGTYLGAKKTSYRSAWLVRL